MPRCLTERVGEKSSAAYWLVEEKRSTVVVQCKIGVNEVRAH
jgi:hypothetical protein